jgi:hypothetical protein
VDSLNRYVAEYKTQIEKGAIVKAYRGLLGYLMELRTHLSAKYPEYICSGIYQGYMDMSYFSFTPPQLKDKKLKIALVLLHDNISWEIWLAGGNRQIQAQYRKLFEEKGYGKYRVSAAGKGVDSIIEFLITEQPDFDEKQKLTALIEEKALLFISDMLDFLSENE